VTVGDTRTETTLHATLTSGTRQFFLPGPVDIPSRTDHVYMSTGPGSR
jgi:hypothetical protein